jgi:hypothetical protein
MIDGSRVVFPGVQVRVRSATPDEGYAKAAAIANALDTTVRQNSVTVEASAGTPTADYVIHSISRVGNVLPLGKNTPSSRRSLFVMNATLTLTAL